jgi:hypothetical protein
MSSAHRYDEIKLEGYVPSKSIAWGSVEPSAGMASSGVQTCHRVQGVWVVSDGTVTEGREVRKFGAASRRSGYNAPVVILGSVAKSGGKWIAYTNAEKVGVYRTRSLAVAAVYAATR